MENKGEYNDFLEMVRRRRSVRKFSDKQIDQSDIARILKAALSAPSSRNCHSSSFMVIEKPELIAQMAQMRDYGSAFLSGAPLVIVVMGDPALTDLWVDNAAISATYLQLAAESLGLSTCWVHVNGRPRLKDDPQAGYAEDYLKEFLPVPEGRHILCAVAVGYSAAEHRPHEVDEDQKVIRVE